MPIHGQNFIAGEKVASGSETYQAMNPATGASLPGNFVYATADELDDAASAAHEATQILRTLLPGRKASLLNRMADEILGLGDELIERCMAETGLPVARLTGERGRTVNQLRMFADLVDEGSWVDARIDTAIPDRSPAPKPDIRRMLIPIGPVAVFCASNFPLAFSVAGGDTASAIASGCAVIVKAHSSHPGTAELVAEAITRAIAAEKLPAGLFSLIHGRGSTTGIELARHPLVQAVGFTGSYPAGKALFDAATTRENPIPVYAEMGSINPVFVLPGALAERGDQIARGLKDSVTLGVGQFCTNPGLVVGLTSPTLSSFIDATATEFSESSAGIMLNQNIQASYERGIERLSETNGVTRNALGAGQSAEEGVPAVFSTSAERFLAEPTLSEEVFGPSTLIVKGESKTDMIEVAMKLEGHLTATIHGTEEDLSEYSELVRILETKVGRIIFNGFPTGVEVCPSMNHGGPYPAASDVHITSVGTAAIYRFARPLCYQGFPDSQLPPELQNANPLEIMRLVNGEFGSAPLS